MHNKLNAQTLAMMNFTPDDLKDWKAYERVRKSGKFNMYDPRARKATKLNGERYSFVMKNFTKLKEAVGKRSETKA